MDRLVLRADRKGKARAARARVHERPRSLSGKTQAFGLIGLMLRLALGVMLEHERLVVLAVPVPRVARTIVRAGRLRDTAIPHSGRRARGAGSLCPSGRVEGLDESRDCAAEKASAEEQSDELHLFGHHTVCACTHSGWPDARACSR